MDQALLSSQAVSADVFKRLIDLGIALSAERNTARLLERIVLGAKDFTNADGGTLYLRTEEDQLRFEIIRNDTLGIAMGGTTGKDIPFPLLPMYRDGQANHNNVATHVALTGRTSNVEDAYAAQFDFSGTKKFDQTTGYRSKSFLTAPLKNHKDEVIGVIQLINALEEGGREVIPFHPDLVPLIEALASLAAVALENQRLISEQRELFDSFIALMANAIDAKSPYTGGHCQRVPVLTEMLAQAACDQTEGPFADFSLTDEQWYELKVAGGLHDVGKVTTPVHIMDKATKLEKIVDRIELVKLRYEVLKRDQEINRLRRIIAGETAESLADDDAQRRRELTDELAFLIEANIGGEFMADAKIDRLKQIAASRTLMVGDHEIPMLDADEIENLSIRRGTLNDADRKVINDHIVHTIHMLEALPFPKSMRNVPEIAGGHHEKMDGTGYPNGLKRDQMSVPARMMGIADIFEALTAADRPYKKPKPLSESVKIMKMMRDQQHIDPDLFELFIRSGVYRDYAERFLAPDQLDAVDEAELLAPPAPRRP